MRSLILSVALSLLISCVYGVAVSCGGSMIFETVTMTPDPPVLGAPASLTAINGVSPTAVGGGAGVMYAFLDGLNVYTSPPLVTCGQSVSVIFVLHF